jgi:hypothetical protein
MSEYYEEHRFVSKDLRKHIIMFIPTFVDTNKFVGDHVIKHRVTLPNGQVVDQPVPVQFDIAATNLEEAFEKYDKALLYYVQSINARESKIQAFGAETLKTLKIPEGKR